MKKLLRSLTIFACATLILPVYMEAAQAAAAPKAKTSGVLVAPEQNWDSILSEAKKEGTVAVYNTAWTSQMRVDLTKAFKAKYGSRALPGAARGA